MFPQTKVIHLRRDPRDTALSPGSQDFAHHDMAFAYDFEDIAADMEGRDALMRYWTLRVPIHELDYEHLVTDTRRRWRFCATSSGGAWAGRALPMKARPCNRPAS